MYYIGLDIGVTRCKITLGKTTKGLEILRNEIILSEQMSPLNVMERFGCYISEWQKLYSIKGIGITCKGIIDSSKGIILTLPNLHSWDNIHIADYFSQRFKIPVILQNYSNACAIAEWKYGAGKGCKNVVFMTFGTGLNAGLILDGKLYRGTNDNAGEIGHLRLAKNGPTGCNKKGSFEGFCSAGGIVRLAQIAAAKEFKKGITPLLLEKAGSIENITANLVAELADSGDRLCKNVYRQSGTRLGQGLSYLIDILNPELFIIGGVYLKSGHLLYSHAKRVIDNESFGLSNSVCKIVPAKLGEKVGDYAALSIAFGEV